MKFLMLSYKDNRIGVFRNPFLYDKPVEDLIVDLKTSFKNIKKEAADQLKDNSLYCVGTFDSKTGEIVPQNEFILDVYPVALSMLDYGGEKDVSVSNEDGKKAN